MKLCTVATIQVGKHGLLELSVHQTEAGVFVALGELSRTGIVQPDPEPALLLRFQTFDCAVRSVLMYAAEICTEMANVGHEITIT